jgi:hypothetical protein
MKTIMLRPILPALFLSTLTLPATADVTVTHRIEGRFGVSYVRDPNGSEHVQSLYEGRYTTTFQHDFDNGVTFRFELGLALGNLDSDQRGPRYPYAPVWDPQSN